MHAVDCVYISVFLDMSNLSLEVRNVRCEKIIDSYDVMYKVATRRIKQNRICSDCVLPKAAENKEVCSYINRCKVDLLHFVETERNAVLNAYDSVIRLMEGEISAGM